jgi:predicted negative regulator of RcsB-dependent stress response
VSYETDEEKVEAIKKWWKDNGMAVVIGIVVGLGAIGGWRAWGEYRDRVGAEASTVFDQALYAALTSQTEAVTARTQQLQQDFSSTPYAALGLLVEAKSRYDAGQTDEAMTALRRAIAEAPEPALGRIAALRLARIQVAEGQLEAAAETVTTHDTSPELAGAFAAVRGDIAAARGDITAARQAYEQALAKGVGLSELVQLKLDNLPATDE